MYSSARDFSFLCCSKVAGVSSPEMRTSGTSRRLGLRRSLLQIAYPIFRGSTDSTMTAGLWCRAHSMASSPLEMFSTTNPFGVSHRRIWSAVAVSGSMQRAIRSAISTPAKGPSS